MATALKRTPWSEDELPHAFDLSGLPRSAYIPLLAAVYAIGLGLFITVEPTQPWILLAVVGLVGLGTDGILRGHPRAQLRNPTDTAPYLFVPVLLALAGGLFLEEVVSGYRVVPAVIGASILLAGALYGEYVSLLSHGPSYALGRLLLNVITYLAAFAFFAVVYAFNVGLLASAFAVGLFSMLLSIEVLREAEADAYRALVFAAVIGIVVGEARWVLYFLPMEDFLAGLLLLMFFYQATGLIQHHLTNTLDRRVAAEFSCVTAIGVAIVVVGRVLSIG